MTYGAIHMPLKSVRRQEINIFTIIGKDNMLRKEFT